MTAPMYSRPSAGLSMSFYTGRHQFARIHMERHSASGRRMDDGDHLREAGMDLLLIGKTHMKVDAAGMERLGLAPDSIIGARLAGMRL